MSPVINRTHIQISVGLTAKRGGGKLLPKSDGSTIMVSGICSRDYCLGVRLSQDQFDEVNLNRASLESEFRHYVSETAELEIYGTTEK